MGTTASNVVDLGAVPIWDRRSLVPDGAYRVALKDWRTQSTFRRGALQCAFIVVDGEHLSAVLMRWYSVTLTGKPQRHGHFKAARGSALVRDFAACFGLPGRLDRIPMERFANKVVTASTRTVTLDSAQQAIPDCLRWSTIERIEP